MQQAGIKNAKICDRYGDAIYIVRKREEHGIIGAYISPAHTYSRIGFFLEALVQVVLA